MKGEYRGNIGSAPHSSYEQLDGKTAEFLRTKERNMREIVGKAYMEIGRELKEAQAVLSNNRNGVFEKWCEYIGMSHKQVTRLIQRYDMLTNCHDKSELLEDLPVSLSYEIAAPSADKTEPKRTAKAAVLNGDIRTLKEYRELVAKLEASEKVTKELTEQNETLRDTVESLAATPPKMNVNI